MAGFRVVVYRGTELVVGPGNSHPSPLQHEMAAEQLFADLERLGILESFAGR